MGSHLLVPMGPSFSSVLYFVFCVAPLSHSGKERRKERRKEEKEGEGERTEGRETKGRYEWKQGSTIVQGGGVPDLLCNIIIIDLLPIDHDIDAGCLFSVLPWVIIGPTNLSYARYAP